MVFVKLLGLIEPLDGTGVTSVRLDHESFHHINAHWIEQIYGEKQVPLLNSENQHAVTEGGKYLYTKICYVRTHTPSSANDTDYANRPVSFSGSHLHEFIAIGSASDVRSKIITAAKSIAGVANCSCIETNTIAKPEKETDTETKPEKETDTEAKPEKPE